MKKFLSIIAIVGLAGAAFAGCGKKVEDVGELTKFDADAKTIMIGDSKLTITPATKVTDAEGEKADLADLEGKKVKVVSEHKKVDSVTVAS